MHRQFPPGTDLDMLDIIAKALMIRFGGSVTLTTQEMREAADVRAECDYDGSGNMIFRVERS